MISLKYKKAHYYMTGPAVVQVKKAYMGCIRIFTENLTKNKKILRGSSLKRLSSSLHADSQGAQSLSTYSVKSND